MSPAPVVIGVGRPCRHDDELGPLVAAAVRARRRPGVTVAETDGDPARLLALWDDAPLAVVVDLVVCRPATPGRRHRLVLSGTDEEDLDAVPTSTHGLGVIEAARLARVLGRGPRRLVVLGVEPADLSVGTGLSPVVARAMPGLVEAVGAELRNGTGPARPRAGNP